jgi:hypothetical protein
MKCVSSVAACLLLLSGCGAQVGVSPTTGGKGGAPAGGGGAGGAGTGGTGATSGMPPKPDFGFQPPPGSDGGFTGDVKNCGAKAFNLERAPAQIVVVLDRSMSMNMPVVGGMGSRWTNITGALNETLMATDSSVLWGFKVFPDPGGCTVADGVNVPIAAMNSMPITTAIQGIAPSGNTPTALAMTKTVEYLKSLGTNTPKYIVLATDGEPNCRGGGIFGGGQDNAGAVMAVAAAAAEGFHTFVVGIATAMTPADTTLGDMAMAGMEPRPVDPKYYPVANRADLVSALGLITGQVTNCIFPLDQLPPAPTDVTVRVNGTVVPRDPAHATGWDLTANGSAVQIYGSYCDMLKASGAGDKIEIVYGCFIP